MNRKRELRLQIINYLCGENELSARFLKLLDAGGMAAEDGWAIKNRLLKHLDSITNLDVFFSEYYFYQYRLRHGLVMSIDIGMNEGVEAANNFIPPTPDGLYSMDDYPYEELKEYQSDEKYLELIYEQFPQTVEEAIDIIIDDLSPEDIKAVLKYSKWEFVGRQHFSLGLFIRNNFLSGSSKASKLMVDIDKRGGPTFPRDSISSYLVGELWEHIHKNYGDSNSENIKGDNS